MAKNKKKATADHSFLKGLIIGIIITAVILFTTSQLLNSDPEFPPTNSSVTIINNGENPDCEFPARNARCPGIHINGMLANAQLQDNDLRNSRLEMTSYASDFSGSNLEGATVTELENRPGTIHFISENNFSGIKGNGVTFLNINIEDTNFQNAELENAVFRSVELIRVDFTNANLKGADFSKARSGYVSQEDLWNNAYQIDFSGANLTGANLTGLKREFNHKVKYSRSTNFSGATWYDGRICGPNSLGFCATSR